MDLRRLSRIINDRWLVVLIGGVLGLVAGILFATLSGPSGQSIYQATAKLRFDPAEGQAIPDLVPQLQDAREFATLAAADLLSSDATSQITLDLAAATLLFTSQGATEAEAEAKAYELLQAYLDVDPELVGSVDDNLRDLQGEAAELDLDIAALQPSLTPQQEQDLAEITDLDLSIDAVIAAIRQTWLSEASATTAQDRAIFVEQRENLQDLLEDFRAERAALPAVPPTAALSTEQALELQSLQARRLQVDEEYQRLFLRKLGVAGEGTYEGVSAIPFASDPLDPVLVATAGLVGGALIAVAGLLMVARTRRIIWLPEDVEVPVLGQIPSRQIQAHGNEAWYDETEPGPRKTAVQALRSAVQAQAHSGGATIALTGHNVPSEDVQALAADLAGSMASAGDSVLLVDANFASGSALGSYRIGGTSLAEILRMRPESPEYRKTLGSAVDGAYMVRPGLAIVPSGPSPLSPADSLAGRQFRSLVASAEETYDYTIVVVDDFGTPSSKVAMQRLRYGIIVTAPGGTTETEMNSLLGEAASLRIGILGAVFLRRRPRLAGLFVSNEPAASSKRSDRSPRSDSPAQAEAPERSPVAEGDPSPMNRLNNYAIPGERRSNLILHSPLGELATSFGLTDEEKGPGLGSELLSAIGSASPENANAAVTEYVVSRTEDMVTARHGYGGLPANLIDDVSDFGFLSLRPIRSHRTVGNWITEEIQVEIQGSAGTELVLRLDEILGVDPDDGGVDHWLSEEFFRRHLDRTGGDPEVWHLVSPGRSVSLLVPARRMSASRLEDIATEVVSGLVDEFERKRKAAMANGDDELADEYEEKLTDVRDFEDRLHQLIYGDAKPESKRTKNKVWRPDWSSDTLANLIPFQRLGLLPFEVLTEEEMSNLSATA